MCQAKKDGGKRCAAHNNDKEHKLMRKRADTARHHYENAAEAALAGEVTEADLAELEAELAAAEQLEILVRLVEHKKAEENRDRMLAPLPVHVRTAAAPVADSVIAHEREAARLAGEAHRERLFDRADEAQRFDAEADAERSRAARLAYGLRAAFYTAKTDITEGMRDMHSGSSVDRSAVAKKTDGKPGIFRSWLIETLEATEEAMVETAEGLAAGLGIAAPDTVPTKAAGNGGLDQDPDSSRPGQDHGVDDDQQTDADDQPTDADDHEPYEDDAADSSTAEKASTERRSPQPAPTARPVAVDGSVGTDDGQDRIGDHVGTPSAGAVRNRVEGQDHDHPAPTPTTPTELGETGGAPPVWPQAEPRPE